MGVGVPMKISRALISAALALVLTSAEGEDSRASAQTIAQPAAQFRPPYPFTEAQIWAILTEVIDLPDSEVTPERMARIFDAPSGLEVTPTRPTSDNVRSYILRAGHDWYFDVFLYRNMDTDAFQFSFDWGERQDVSNRGQLNLPIGMCITRETIVTTMEARGWQTVGAPEEAPTGVTTAAPPNSESVVPPPPVVPLPPRDPELNFSLPPSRSAKVYFQRAGQCLMLLSVTRRGRS